MKGIFAILKQVFHKSILIVSTISLLILSSLFIFVEQPSLAAPISTEGQKMIQQEQRDKASQAVDQIPDSYEAEVEAEKNPDKVYEKNLKAYEKTNPGEGLVEKAVEGAEKLVDKVTGKE